MATYLDAIIQSHRHAAARDARSRADLERAAHQADPTRAFVDALRRPDGEIAIIAEVKRRSPVTGELGGDLDPAKTAFAYERGGAACISVLTDVEYFGGSEKDLRAAREATTIPVLRKDFTVAEADVFEARAMGADAVLLIAAVLSDDELQRFSQLAKELGLAVLCEVHDEREIERALDVGSEVIGVNQRDLHTFAVDTTRAVRLRSHIPDSTLAVAESGVKDAADVARLRDAGFHGVLIGSALVCADDPAQAVRMLTNPAGVA